MPVHHSVSLVWQAVSLPKRGHSAEEYEDAFAADAEAGRFAIADGASESAYAGLWARLLTDGFVHPVRVSGADWLTPVQQRWAAQVDGKPLPWYADVKRQEGAFTTFLGLTVRLRAGKPRAWKAVAVGDSCLFQVRRDSLVRQFPLGCSNDFNTSPALVGSRPPSGAPLPQKSRTQGRYEIGDRMLLMTDALAQWFLEECEQGARPWRDIRKLLSRRSSEAAFAAWVEKLRDRGSLRNDDVTLLSVCVENGRNRP